MIHTLLVPRSFKKDKEMYILLNVNVLHWLSQVWSC